MTDFRENFVDFFENLIHLVIPVGSKQTRSILLQFIHSFIYFFIFFIVIFAKCKIAIVFSLIIIVLVAILYGILGECVITSVELKFRDSIHVNLTDDYRMYTVFSFAVIVLIGVTRLFFDPSL